MFSEFFFSDSDIGESTLKSFITHVFNEIFKIFDDLYRIPNLLLN